MPSLSRWEHALFTSSFLAPLDFCVCSSVLVWCCPFLLITYHSAVRTKFSTASPVKQVDLQKNNCVSRKRYCNSYTLNLSYCNLVNKQQSSNFAPSESSRRCESLVRCCMNISCCWTAVLSAIAVVTASKYPCIYIAVISVAAGVQQSRRCW